MRAGLSPVVRVYAAIVFVTTVWLALGHGSDFHVYWHAGAALRSGGWVAVYEVSQLAAFKYHPFFALLLYPFGLLPEQLARIAWAIVNGAMVLDMMVRWRRHWQLDAAAIGLGFLALGHALFWQYAYGNVAFVMLWLWTVALTTPSRWRSSFCYAVLIALKPFWLALVVPWWLYRHRDLFARVAAILVALSALPIVAGTHAFTIAYERWIATLADPWNARNYAAFENQSWNGFLYRHADLFGPHPMFLWLAGSALVGIVWLWQWRGAIAVPLPQTTRWKMELSLTPFILWTAPLSWIHHQILLWPLLALAWQRGRESGVARWVWIATAILLTGLSQSIIGRAATLEVLAWGVPLLAFVILDWWASPRRLDA